MSEIKHYGVQGMKWGFRKDKAPMTRSEKIAVAKKAAIGTGVLVGAVGAALVSSKLKEVGDKPISDITESPRDLPNLDGLFLASRSKNSGYRVMNDGNHPSPLDLMDSVFGSGLNDSSNNNRLYDSPKGMGVNLDDPEGRTDRAGRVISHTIIIPNSMKSGINNADDVVRDIWPLIKEDYDYGE